MIEFINNCMPPLEAFFLLYLLHNIHRLGKKSTDKRQRKRNDLWNGDPYNKCSGEGREE